MSRLAQGTALPLLALTLLGSAGCAIHARPSAPPDLRAAPPFELEAHTGERVSLDGLLAEGVAVVVFYRGYW